MIRRLLSRLRRPAPVAPIVDQRSDAWRPGDLALCIRDDWIAPCRHAPRAGAILRVRTVEDLVVHGSRDWYLTFTDRPHLYSASAFRKLVAGDADFAALIARPRRTQKSTPAVAPAGAPPPLVPAEKETKRPAMPLLGGPGSGS